MLHNSVLSLYTGNVLTTVATGEITIYYFTVETP